MRIRSLLPFCALGALVSACGAGSAAIASSGGSSAGVNANAPTQIVAVDVTSRRVSPAQVAFSVVDAEQDSATVEVRFTTDGTFAGSTLIATRTIVGSAGAGTAVVQPFAFAAPLGVALTKNVLVFVVLAGQTDVNLGINAVFVALGNDAPTMSVDASSVPGPAEEASGALPVNFTVVDSSGDDVRVRVQFTANPNDPVPTWTDARPSGFPGATTPAFAFDPVTALAGGTKLTFAWDSEFDLDGRDVEVELRFVATEIDAPGESTNEADGLTGRFRIDNNMPPEIALDVVGFALNADQSRTIPVPFVVADEESDAIDVLFQWRTQAGSFPALPTSVDDLRRVARDPVARQALQLATESPRTFEATVHGTPSATGARLSELGTSAAILASRKAADPVGSLRGLELQVMRPQPPANVSLGWAQNHLLAPVGVVVGERGKAFVLDRPGAGQWRVREVDLASGDVGPAIGGAQTGTPNAIAAVPGEARLLVASNVGGTWSVTRLDLLDATATPVFTSNAGLPSGAVRGIVGRRGERCLVTVADALVEVAFPSGGPASARTVLDPGVLAAPAGIVADPLDDHVLFVAENGRNRVVRLDLATLALSTVRLALGGTPRPTALAFESGRRLLVLSDANPNDGTRELLAAKLGLRPTGFGSTLAVVQLASLPAGTAALAAGEAGARVTVDATTAAVFVGGGIEQVRTVTDYDPAQFRVAVDAPFLPAIGTGTRCRLVERSTALSMSGPSATGTFLWDARDVPGSLEVELRAIAFDRDVGPVGTSSPKALRGALDGAAVNEIAATARFAADVDGDGDTDLITGTDLFVQSAPGVFSATSLPVSLLEFAADVDGDGLVDVIGNGNLHRLLQGSPPTFGAAIPLGTAFDTVVDVGDVDRDGRVDLLLRSGNIRYQTASLTFVSGPAATQVGFPPIGPLLRDADGDGDLDVAFGNGSIEFVVQDAAGNFGSVQTVPSGFIIAQAFSMAVADLDLDGVNDFVVPQPFDNFNAAPGVLTTVFSGSGVVEIDPPAGASGSVTAEVADVDADGLRDVVVEQQGNSITSVFHQTAPGVLDTGSATLSSLSGSPRLARDVDGDGVLDLTGRDPSSSAGAVVYSRTNGAIDPTVGQRLGFALTGFDDCALGDFDADGDIDIVGTEPSIAFLHVVDQIRPGIFEDQAGVSFLNEVLPRAVGAAELSGDGRTDFFTALGPGSTTDSGIFVSAGGFFTDQAFPTFARELEAVDLDGTGTLEILRVADLGGTELAAWRRTATGPFTSYVPIFSAPIPDVTSVEVADVDADGLGDLLVTIAGDVRLLRQGPLDTFTPTTVAPGDGGLVIVAADLDRDGRVDFATSGGGTTRFYFQNPSGGFDLAATTLPFASGRTRVTDLDDDGYPDLVLVSGGTRAALQVLPRVFVENARLATSGPSPNDVGDIDGDGELDSITVSGSRIETRFGGR